MKKTYMYRTLIFDLDDTLVDFKNSENKSLSLTHKRFFSKSVSKEDFIKSFHEINKNLWASAEMLEIPIGDIGLKRFEKLSKALNVNIELVRLAEFYEKQLVANTKWLPEVRDSLSKLSKRYKLCVVTNGFTRVQKAKYSKFSLERWFSEFIISEQFGLSKPHKGIFDYALEKMKTMPGEALIVGDSCSSDYQGALNSGIDFCWINPQALQVPKKFPRPMFNLQSVAELDQII